MAAVYRAVWAGDRTTNRALFAALPSDTLRLVDANGTWTNIATVGPACLRTGFATDCPCIDVLVEADSAQPRVPMREVYLVAARPVERPLRPAVGRVPARPRFIRLL